jgi:hypothetical protein
MKLRIALKLVLASSVAACCLGTAAAQTVDSEFTGTVSSLQGAGWSHSDIGQSVTLDFKYDAGAISSSINGSFYIESAPVTSASIVRGALGSGINLERDGSGTGTIADTVNLNTGDITARVETSANAPRRGFTGDVFGLSFFTDGIHTTLDVVRNAFHDGIYDSRDSGKAFLSNVNVVSGNQAPEIDPTSALSALTLLMGGLAVMGGKKFSKAPTA